QPGELGRRARGRTRPRRGDQHRSRGGRPRPRRPDQRCNAAHHRGADVGGALPPRVPRDRRWPAPAAASARTQPRPGERRRDRAGGRRQPRRARRPPPGGPHRLDGRHARRQRGQDAPADGQRRDRAHRPGRPDPRGTQARDRARPRRARRLTYHPGVKVVRRTPPAPARAYVAGMIEGWEQSVASTVRMREVPIPGVPLIVNLGAPWEIESAGRTEEYDSFTGGLSTAPAFVRGGASWSCVELRLTPIGARRLFGWPMHELSNTTVALEDFLPEARELVERVRDSSSWSDRFDLVDAFLVRRLSRSADPPPELAWSWQRLHASHGCASIGELASELGWSHRRLIARFRDHIGLPPKTLAPVIRFDRVVHELRAPSPNSLAEVAFDCGYFDQAHLNRDFREFAGTTPAAFVAAQLGSGAIAA